MAKKQISTRGHSYELTAKGVKELGESGGQQSVIFRAMKGKQLTAAEITKRVSSSLKTKQEKGLVVGFYLTAWKADGLVRFAKKAAKASTPRKASNVTPIAQSA